MDLVAQSAFHSTRFDEVRLRFSVFPHVRCYISFYSSLIPTITMLATYGPHCFVSITSTKSNSLTLSDIVSFPGTVTFLLTVDSIT
jgi:hypothetical protein